MEPKCIEMSDDELKEQTAKFRQRLSAGETVDDLLVEFADCDDVIDRLEPGDSATIEGEATGLNGTVINEVTVTCEIEGAVNKSVTRDDTAECTDIVEDPNFEVSKECTPQDANGENHVFVTLTNTGNSALVCDVLDDLLGATVLGVVLPVSGQQTIDFGPILGLTADTLNTATATCTSVGGQSIEKSGSDLCEVPRVCEIEVENTF